MNEYLESVCSGNGFMPHGLCYLWTSGLAWLHAISDAMIVLASFSIPIALVYFVRHRKDPAFARIFVSIANVGLEAQVAERTAFLRCESNTSVAVEVLARGNGRLP